MPIKRAIDRNGGVFAPTNWQLVRLVADILLTYLMYSDSSDRAKGPSRYDVRLRAKGSCI